jgi:hypothetical protein
MKICPAINKEIKYLKLKTNMPQKQSDMEDFYSYASTWVGIL